MQKTTVFSTSTKKIKDYCIEKWNEDELPTNIGLPLLYDLERRNS